MGRVIKDLEAIQRDDLVVPMMITVDPRRDSVSQVRQYVKDFHPKIVGLTGTPGQIKEVSKAYRVYSSTGLTEQEEEESEDYLVDHTIFFYLMGPDGVIRSYYGKQMTSEQVTEGIVKEMNEDYELLNGPSFWNILLGKT